MKATDIKVGKLYAATTYGKPQMGRQLRQYKVIREVPTTGGRQKKFEVKQTGSLNSAWKLQPTEANIVRILKSGNFYDHWSAFNEEVAKYRKEQEEYEKRREEKQQEQEREKEARKETIKEVANLTGVLLFDPDGSDYRDRYALTGTSCEIKWEKIEALLESLKGRQALSQEASQDAMDILGDVF